MAELSKNARGGVGTEKFYCSCGGEIKMKTIFTNGKLRNVAKCEQCNKVERRPRDFR